MRHCLDNDNTGSVIRRRDRRRTTTRQIMARTRSCCLLLLLFLFACPVRAQQSSENPLEMYGGSLLAMAGRDAVVLVTDQRFGRGLGLLTSGYSRPVWNDYLSSTTPKSTSDRSTTTTALSTPRPRWLMTATGLPGDVQSLQADVQAILQRQHAQLPLAVDENDDGTSSSSKGTSTRAALTLLSHLLYQRRGYYLVDPLLIGFDDSDDDDENNKNSKRPILCSLDMLGATSITHNYLCAGGAAAGLWGSAARYYQANLSTQDLVERAVQAFGAGVDRDILSGYGALVHILHANGKWEEWQVSTRND